MYQVAATVAHLYLFTEPASAFMLTLIAYFVCALLKSTCTFKHRKYNIYRVELAIRTIYILILIYKPLYPQWGCIYSETQNTSKRKTGLSLDMCANALHTGQRIYNMYIVLYVYSD